MTRGRWWTAGGSLQTRIIAVVSTITPGAEARSRPPVPALFRHGSEWASLIDFEIEPVVTDEEAGPILKGMA